MTQENLFKINTLVTHKKSSYGIGCISKILKRGCVVNFGLNDSVCCKSSQLTPLDVSSCKTITFNEVKAMMLSNSDKLPKYLIIGNELQEYVGIGWIKKRIITVEDLTEYQRVI